MNDSVLSRREIVMMATGGGAICLGGLIDGWINPSISETTAGLAAAIKRLNDVPVEIGGWTSESLSLSEREQSVAGIRGYLRREYYHRETGHRAGLTILCGASGPMSVHPPTACFEGSGFRVASGPTITSFEISSAPQPSRFNLAAFQRRDSRMPLQVRVFWGWGTTGDWLAPSHPRLEFRGLPWLYKLYATDRWPSLDPRTVVPQADGFLREALPVIRDALSDREQPSPLSSVTQNRHRFLSSLPGNSAC